MTIQMLVARIAALEQTQAPDSRLATLEQQLEAMAAEQTSLRHAHSSVVSDNIRLEARCRALESDVQSYQEPTSAAQSSSDAAAANAQLGEAVADLQQQVDGLKHQPLSSDVQPRVEAAEMASMAESVRDLAQDCSATREEASQAQAAVLSLESEVVQQLENSSASVSAMQAVVTQLQADFMLLKQESSSTSAAGAGQWLPEGDAEGGRVRLLALLEDHAALQARLSSMSDALPEGSQPWTVLCGWVDKLHSDAVNIRAEVASVQAQLVKGDVSPASATTITQGGSSGAQAPLELKVDDLAAELCTVRDVVTTLQDSVAAGAPQPSNQAAQLAADFAGLESRLGSFVTTVAQLSEQGAIDPQLPSKQRAAERKIADQKQEIDALSTEVADLRNCMDKMSSQPSVQQGEGNQVLGLERDGKQSYIASLGAGDGEAIPNAPSERAHSPQQEGGAVAPTEDSNLDAGVVSARALPESRAPSDVTAALAQIASVTTQVSALGHSTEQLAARLDALKNEMQALQAASNDAQHSSSDTVRELSNAVSDLGQQVEQVKDSVVDKAAFLHHVRSVEDAVASSAHVPTIQIAIDDLQTRLTDLGNRGSTSAEAPPGADPALESMDARLHALEGMRVQLDACCQDVKDLTEEHQNSAPISSIAACESRLEALEDDQVVPALSQRLDEVCGIVESARADQADLRSATEDLPSSFQTLERAVADCSEQLPGLAASVAACQRAQEEAAETSAAGATSEEPGVQSALAAVRSQVDGLEATVVEQQAAFAKQVQEVRVATDECVSKLAEMQNEADVVRLIDGALDEGVGAAMQQLEERVQHALDHAEDARAQADAAAALAEQVAQTAEAQQGSVDIDGPLMDRIASVEEQSAGTALELGALSDVVQRMHTALGAAKPTGRGRSARHVYQR